ncbi:hypothetical protein Q6310_26915, partial [Klebsiella pneumoniae]
DLHNHRARRPQASAHWCRPLGDRRDLVLDLEDEYR